MTREEQIKQFSESEGYSEDLDINGYLLVRKGARWADAHPNWHLCKEEMPHIEEGKYRSDKMLVVDKYDRYHIAFYDNMMEDWMDDDFVNNDFTRHHVAIAYIVAWMELPKFNQTI